MGSIRFRGEGSPDINVKRLYTVKWYNGSPLQKSPWISKKPFILHLIEWHKKVISFSEWRHFQINYPSNQIPANQRPTKIRAHQPGANVTLLPAKNVAQESLSSEVIVMPLEDDVAKLEPNDNECFEVPVQVIPSMDVVSTNQRSSSIPQPKQVQTVTAQTNEISGQKRKSEIICIADEHENKKRISNDYISHVKEAMDQFIQTYHLSTRN